MSLETLFYITLAALLVGIIVPQSYALWRGVLHKIRFGFWE